MNFELSSVYSNYNLGAKVVKNREICKSLLYFMTTLPNNMLQKSSACSFFSKTMKHLKQKRSKL